MKFRPRLIQSIGVLGGVGIAVMLFQNCAASFIGTSGEHVGLSSVPANSICSGVPYGDLPSIGLESIQTVTYVSPYAIAEDSRIFLNTGEQVYVSTDCGREFKSIPGAANLVAGMQPAGSYSIRSIAAAGNSLILTLYGAVFFSKDGGMTFKELPAPAGIQRQDNVVAMYSGGTFYVSNIQAPQLAQSGLASLEQYSIDGTLIRAPIVESAEIFSWVGSDLLIRGTQMIFSHRVGLIASNDSGQTLKAISLESVADQLISVARNEDVLAYAATAAGNNVNAFYMVDFNPSQMNVSLPRILALPSGYNRLPGGNIVSLKDHFYFLLQKGGETVVWQADRQGVTSKAALEGACSQRKIEQLGVHGDALITLSPKETTKLCRLKPF